MPDDRFNLVPEMFEFVDDAPRVHGYHTNVSVVSDFGNDEPRVREEVFDRAGAGEGLLRSNGDRLVGEIDVYFADLINDTFRGATQVNNVTRVDITELWRLSIDRDGGIELAQRDHRFTTELGPTIELRNVEYARLGGGHFASAWEVQTWGWYRVASVARITMSFDRIFNVGDYPRWYPSPWDR